MIIDISSPETRIPDAYFEVVNAFRTFSPHIIVNKYDTLDIHPNHGLACKKVSSNAKKHRHDRINRKLQQFVREAGHTVDSEVVLSDQPHPRRMDSMIKISHGGMGRTLFTDISVVCSTAKSYIDDDRKMGAARRMVAHKRRKYQEEMAACDGEFIPMVFDVYGGWTKEAIDLMNEIASHAEADAVPDSHSFRTHWIYIIAVTLAQGNSTILEKWTMENRRLYDHRHQ